MPEIHDHKVKRLHMRSMRRGIKEMDLILSAFAAVRLAQMTPTTLALYDQLLDENDHDLYQWVTGQTAAPDEFGAMIEDIRTVMLSANNATSAP